MAFPIDEIFGKKLPGKAGHTDLESLPPRKRLAQDETGTDPDEDEDDNPDIRMSVA